MFGDSSVSRADRSRRAGVARAGVRGLATVGAVAALAVLAGVLAAPAGAQQAPPPPAAGAPLPTAAARDAGVDRYEAVPAGRVRDPATPVTTTAVPVPVAGRAGVPTDGSAGAVVLTVGAVPAAAPGAPGSVTVWSGDGPAPAIPTLAVTPGRTATTTAVVPLGVDGRIAVTAAPGPAAVSIDVTGWFPVASTLVTGPPTRLLDSRGGTVDGRDARSGPVRAGTAVPLQVGGRGFGSSPPGSSVLLSVSASRAALPSALTVWPSGTPQPPIPSVPLSATGDTHDTVFARVGRDGAVDVALAQGSADVVVDLVAVVPARSVITPVEPARVFDSRPGTVTVDGRDGAAGALTPGTDRRLALGNRGGVPAAATAVLAHLTVTTAGAPAEVRAWGGGTPPPGPSLAPAADETRSGLVVLPLAPDGSAVVRADRGAVDLAVDVQGWIGVGQEPSRSADEVVWRGDVESGDLRQFTDTPYNHQGAPAPEVVRDPVRGGGSAVRFTMPGGGQRTEIEPDVPNFKEGDTRFFAVSMFLAPGFPTDTDAWQVVTQWKNTGTGSPPIEIKVGRGRFFFDGGAGDGGTPFVQDIGPAPVGRWVDLVAGITFSRTPGRARVDAWMDGRQTVTDYHPPGGTLYGSTSSYLKTGIYRDPAITRRAVLTMDDWRVATSFAAATGP